MSSVQIIFGLLMFAGASIGNDNNNNCVISEEELKEVRDSVLELYERENKFPRHSNCDNLIQQSETCANEYKTFVSNKIEKTNEIYDEKLQEFEEMENEMLEELRSVARPFTEKDQKEIDQLSKKIENLHDQINKLKIDKEKHLLDIAYYEDVLGNGTKYSSRFDLDSFFENAKKCSFKRSTINGLISKLNDIFQLTLGKPRSSQGECFDEIRFQLSTVEDVVTYRTGENKLAALKSTHDVKAKYYRKLIDDYSLQVEQETQKKVNFLTDELQKLVLELNKLSNENAVLRRQSAVGAMKTIKLMIRSGNGIRKAKQLFLRIPSDVNDPYKEVLKRTYSCEAEYLGHVIVFAQMNLRTTGYKIIVNEMKRCDQMDSAYLLPIAKSLKNSTLDEFVEKVYENFVEQIRQKNYEKLKFTMQKLPDSIDFSRLFALALNQLKLKDILDFIDSLHAYSQHIIVKLYDKLMELGYKEKQEHIEIGTWIRNKQNWIRLQPSASSITGDLEPYLETLKSRLPNGIRIFLYEPWVIISTKDHEYLLRSDTHTSVKFKVQPDESGKFYRFEDLRYNKCFYAKEFKDEKSKVSANRVRMGNGFAEADYWEIILTDDAEFFYLKNKANGYFLSSEEENVCLATNFIRSCKQREWMNKAHADNSAPSTKWMFTERLIRNGLLPDRSN